MFPVVGVLLFCKGHAIEFSDVDLTKDVFFNAGQLGDHVHYKNYIGLNLVELQGNYIECNLLDPIPLPDSCVDRFHSEDVFEHIEYSELVGVIDEIFRILKVGGFLRIAVPDYRCDILYTRTLKDNKGNFLFDPGGKGRFLNGKVIDGGHVWFPKIESVTELLENTKFAGKGKIKFYHYFDTDGTPVLDEIDYTKGWVKRTPDHDGRVRRPRRPMSIVVDCIKVED